MYQELAKQIPGNEYISQSSRARVIIQTSPLIFLGIHAIIVEGPGWSGIGIIQYIWAYCPLHTFEVKGGGAIVLKVSQAGTFAYQSVSRLQNAFSEIYLQVYQTVSRLQNISHEIYLLVFLSITPCQGSQIFPQKFICKYFCLSDHVKHSL